MYGYLKDLKPNVAIIYVLHEGKQHGLDDKVAFDKIVKANPCLVITPDGGSNDYKEHKKLKELGIDVLVLDHHQSKKYSEDAVVINNQLAKKVTNKSFVGVGVTYKFCQYLDYRYGVKYADKMLPLVALGNIADMCDCRNLETRYYVKKGIECITDNEFIKELIDKNSFDMENKVNIHTLAWNVIPKINSCIRGGSKKEKDDTFRALIGEQEFLEYKPRKSKNNPEPQIEIHSLQKTMARVCGNIKQRLDKATKTGLEAILELINKEGLQDNKVMVVDATGVLNTTCTGLVANKLVSLYKRPVFLLQSQKDKPHLYGGSARGYEATGVSLKDLATKSGLFEKAEGHDNSFGYDLPKTNVDKLIKYMNNALSNYEIDNDNTYEVDYSIPFKDLDETLVRYIGSFGDEWGCWLNEPVFRVEGIKLSNKDIKLVEMGNIKLLKFKVGNITFSKKYCKESLYDHLRAKPETGFVMTKEVTLNVIGKFKLNEYNGKSYPTIDIVDAERIENTVDEVEFVW